jgi:quercetin dioxygenase-like cupin family protein
MHCGMVQSGAFPSLPRRGKTAATVGIGVLMLKTFALGIAIAAICCAPTSAQQRGQGRGGFSGVSPSTIMDTPDVRVTRVQIDAGAVRPSHSHNEGPFHMFIPITGPVQVFFGPEGKEDMETVAPGQVHFFKSNTPHGFRNPGSTPVTFIEIFVKNTGRASADPGRALAAALDAIRSKP